MNKSTRENLLFDLIQLAQKNGAQAADAVFIEGQSLSVTQRMGQRESIQRSEDHDLGLRVFIDQQQSIVSTTDINPATLKELVDRVISMAKVAPKDPFAGVADPSDIAKDFPTIDLFDPIEPSTEILGDRAAAAEEAALAVSGVTNSEGGEASWSKNCITLACSNGFQGSYERSGHSLSAVVLAGQGQKMERDYDYSSAIYGTDLRDAESIGKTAGLRAVSRLNPRRPSSASVPVVFDSRVSNSLINHLAASLNGNAIARGTSFLKDCMDKLIFSSEVKIMDDPHRSRGLRSKPFDAEGITTRPITIVEDGYIKSWLLDLATSRQLGIRTTGHAGRSAGSSPSPSASNLYLLAGNVTSEELISDITSGLLVTELMGMSVNLVTGDYSRGAGGFWIENGEISYPVSDVTVAGNLSEMFSQMIPANDLEFKHGIDAPTVRVNGMTVAGPGD